MLSGSITDVAGLKVGHFTDSRRPTGCTVVLCPAGAVAGVDVRGAAPGTRETDLLKPDNLVEQVHAVVLAGGSAFGLDAASGVMRWLAERAYGFIVGAVRVPIVPAAVLFDFWLGDASIRPDASAGYAACENASDQAPEEGSVGAGAGAVVGKMFGMERAMRGGIGSAAAKIDGVTVGALVAVNSGGDVVDAHTDQVIAGARTPDGTRLLNSTAALMRGEKPAPPKMGSNTTIGIVATDALLTKVQATRIATMAHDGLARSINPVHTLLDGDTMFALGTGTSGREISATLLGTVAAEVTAAAVLRAVRAAQGLPEFPAARDLSGSI